MVIKKHTLEQIVAVTRDVFKANALGDAYVELATADRIIVGTSWSQLDVDKNERLKFSTSYLFDIDNASQSQLKLSHVTRPQALRNDLWNVKSPDQKLSAVVLNWKENNEDKQFLEIWRGAKRLSNVNLSKEDKHGKVYENSSCLGSLVWSANSKRLAYVAESKKLSKEKCLLTSKPPKPEETSLNAANKDVTTTSVAAAADAIDENNFEDRYSNFYVDDWGEQYVGKSQSTIAVYDVGANEFKILDRLPTNLTPAHITWYKNEGLVFSAYYTQPYKLGLVYCPIRKSELFYYDLEANTCTQLTDYKTENVRDPRFSHDAQTLCWLQNMAGGPHCQSSKLVVMDWATKNVRTLVDVVRDFDSAFPGIYAVKFPADSCWSEDDQRILLNTNFRSTNRTIAVDVESGQVTVLDLGLDMLTSCNLLRVCTGDWICALEQSYTRPPSLMLARLPKRGQEATMKWTRINLSGSEEDDDENRTPLANVKLIKHVPKIAHPKYPNLQYESLFVHATNSECNDTLIVFPHGGPHSAYGCEYSTHVAVFYRLGFSVLMLNFRGSIGFGQDSIDSLPGNISVNDVRDCQQATEEVMAEFGLKRAVMYGGSHGGFLTTQLIGQFPDFYTAAAARNPVVDLLPMLACSDIPDWVACEGLAQYEFDPKILLGDPLVASALFERSPIRHVNNVKTPTLIMIGNSDLRVPPAQGIEFHKALLARNVTTKLVNFKEDNHPLDRPQTNVDCVVLTVLWYEKFMFE